MFALVSATHPGVAEPFVGVYLRQIWTKSSLEFYDNALNEPPLLEDEESSNFLGIWVRQCQFSRQSRCSAPYLA